MISLLEFNQLKNNVIAAMQVKHNPAYQYHTPEHTLRVLRDTEFLAKKSGLDQRNTMIVKLAALYHDYGFVDSPPMHEKVGAELAAKELKKLELKQSVIDEIGSIILATQVPQLAKTLNQKIVCDADLFYLGTSYYFEIAYDFYKELKHMKKVNSWQDWRQQQIRFLNTHQFYTDYAQKYLAPNKQNVLKLLTNF